MDRLRAMGRPRAAAVGALLSTCLLAPAGAAHALETRADNTVTIPAGSVVDDDLAACGSEVFINGAVQGDAAVAGSTVASSGRVDGDLLAAGGTVVVRDVIGGSLRAVGGTIDVSGPIGRSATIAGGTVVMQRGAWVGRNASIAGSQVSVLGRVARDLDVTGDQVSIGAPVGGSVTVRGEQVTVLPAAVIQGDLDVYSPKTAEISPDAKVLGAVHYHPIAASDNDAPVSPIRRFGAWLFDWMVATAALFLLSVTVNAASPRGFAGVAAAMRRNPGGAACNGVAAMAVVPIGAFIALCTVVAAPAALAALAAFGLALIVSEAFVADWIGERFAAWYRLRSPGAPLSPQLRLLVGCAIACGLGAIPAIGWLFSTAFVLVGSGAILAALAEARRRGSATGNGAGDTGPAR